MTSLILIPSRTRLGTAVLGTAVLGTPPDYTQFEADGTMQAYGEAACWRDELQSVIGAAITSPSADFQVNIPESSVTAEATARYPTDYITTNWQINHDWELGQVNTLGSRQEYVK